MNMMPQINLKNQEATRKFSKADINRMAKDSGWRNQIVEEKWNVKLTEMSPGNKALSSKFVYK
jgi:hypothetical protein